MNQSIAPSPVSGTTVEVNGRTYAAPKRPTVVIIVDGVLKLRLVITEHPDHALDSRRRISLALRQLCHGGGVRLRRMSCSPQQNAHHGER